jgi:hypothetical protein
MEKVARKNSNLAASLNELARLGSLVDLSVVECSQQIEVDQIGGVHDSGVFELPGGMVTGCILDLVITNQTQKTIYCHDIDLCLPWKDSFFHWLEDPREVNGHNFYRLSHRHGVEFARERVLNHKLLGGGKLAPRCPVKGWLLGIGGPFPAALRHGDWIDATLRILESDHSKHSTSLVLWTERLTMKRTARSGMGSVSEPAVAIPAPIRDARLAEFH